MTIIIAKELADEIGDRFDFEVRYDYSGRFMYGKRCFAIVGGPSDLMKFALTLPSIYEDHAYEQMDDDQVANDELVGNEVPEEWQDVRWDNMGRDLVFYWPNVWVTSDSDEA